MTPIKFNKVFPALCAVVALAGCGVLVNGCNNSSGSKTLSDSDYAKAFDKSAAPAGYANWQKKGTAPAPQ